MRQHTVLLIFLIIPLYLPGNALTLNSNGISVDFSFQLTNGTFVNLSDYGGDKVVVVDWAASWCPVCKKNQKVISTIYNEYNDQVNFISLSYGGSGDELSDVLEMKGNYPWDFGLDVNNAAKQYNVWNGFVWVLDKNLHISTAFNYTVITKTQLVSALNDVLELQTTVENNDQTDLGLFSNPFFLGFLAFVGFGTIIILLQKIRK